MNAPASTSSSPSIERGAYRSKIAIVGGGFCGLGIAAAFARRGIAFDLLEADDEIGGNWYHGVYETVHIISSRKTTEYTDWPMPASYPDFPSAAQMLAYLKAYADHWQLRPHIEFGTWVERVRPVDGENAWAVEIAGKPTRWYRGVVVANGHHWDKRLPEYPGEFSGTFIHSKDYKRPEQLVDKRVLVIGGGNSACDIAVEAARYGKTSDISLRRGYWFLPKSVFGIPSVELINPWLPVAAQRMLLRGVVRLMFGKYENYGLQTPDHRIFEHHPTINDQLLYYIKHGRITPHPDIARYDGEVVHFVDGSRGRFDLIVAATGYHVSLPMLGELVQWDARGFPNLIAGIVHPEHKHLYTFGLSQVRYGAGPLVTAGAELLATMVTVQERLEQPIGQLLAKLGTKPPQSWLVDPMAALRRIRFAQWLVPKLPRLEPWLARSNVAAPQ